jgi:hypothetical protein
MDPVITQFMKKDKIMLLALRSHPSNYIKIIYSYDI